MATVEPLTTSETSHSRKGINQLSPASSPARDHNFEVDNVNEKHCVASSSSATPPLSPFVRQKNVSTAERRQAIREFMHSNVDDVATAVVNCPLAEHQGTLFSHIIRCPAPSHDSLRGSGLYMELTIVRAESPLAGQVLKDDHFGGIHSLEEPPIFPGAPNFRKTRGDCAIFGVAQPRMKECKSIIRYIINNYRVENIVWINLREEPVVYINGSSFSARDAETLHVNLDHLLGIEREDLEVMERRLKADIVADARNKGGCFDIFREGNDMKMLTDWEVVNSESLLTPREVFNTFHKLPVSYYRIPITGTVNCSARNWKRNKVFTSCIMLNCLNATSDECAPEEKDFDELVSVLKYRDRHSAIVCNCQMGKGRTTTGMVIAHLIRSASKATEYERYRQTNPCIPSYNSDAPDLQRGQFDAIMRLVAALLEGN